ncbi:MAG: sigma 54-interacting transcriptional regulator [Bacteriovorax sp.]|nr:sigma 54-interacting transcriptional regulator [Bacteriovorax sp.]
MDQSLLSKIININSPILITGPSGTGKSQMAKSIYSRSRINKDQFLVLHLASIKEDLLESELFGHKKGSFTGASENKIGYFQEVGKGTLFLDEIGELSLESQKKLLYVLEERKYVPIGSTQTLDFRGRLIMATNKDLNAMVLAGTFREDLFFRLSVFHIELDSISSDQNKLSQVLNDQFELLKNLHQKQDLKMGNDIKNFMLNAPWKGNFRELRNTLEYMVVMSNGLALRKEDFPERFLNGLQPSQAKNEMNFISHFPEDYNLALESFEEWYLKAMFERFSGKVNETARVLGISKTTLINKARKYQINTLEIRARASTEKCLKLAA